MFKNMKIEINEQQPLDEVVKELERLGYEKSGWAPIDSVLYICSSSKGFYSNYSSMGEYWDEFITTLAELKDMPLNDFGFDFKQQPSNTVELGMKMLEEGVK